MKQYYNIPPACAPGVLALVLDPTVSFRHAPVDVNHTVHVRWIGQSLLTTHQPYGVIIRRHKLLLSTKYVFQWPFNFVYACSNTFCRWICNHFKPSTISCIPQFQENEPRGPHRVKRCQLGNLEKAGTSSSYCC